MKAWVSLRQDGAPEIELTLVADDDSVVSYGFLKIMEAEQLVERLTEMIRLLREKRL